MAQMKDSFGTEYYITDFSLLWDMEKPALLKASSIIPAGTVADASIIETACGTTNQYINAIRAFNGDLYACGNAIANGLPGKIYRYVDEQFWEPCYEGEGLAESPKQVILSISGTYLYFICASSPKIYYTTNGMSWSQIGTLTGGTTPNHIMGFAYGGTNYIYVSIGKKIWRAPEASSTWTDMTPSAGDYPNTVIGKDVYCLASFNGKLWMANSYSGSVHYSTDGGAYWYYLYNAAFSGTPNFMWAYSSFLFTTSTYSLYPDRNPGRICLINTGNGVANVGTIGAGDGAIGVSAAQYDSKSWLLTKDGKIYYTTDGSGSTWAQIIDTTAYAYGKGVCLSKESGSTYLWVGTNEYSICKISGTAGSYTYAQAKLLNDPNYTNIKNVNALWVGSITYAGGGTTYVNDGFMSKCNGAPDSGQNFYAYYGWPEQLIHDIAVFGGYIYAVTGTHGFVLRSANGIDWDIVFDSSASTLFAIGTTLGYIWVAGNGGYVWRSSNGTTWSTVGSMTDTVICMTKSYTTTVHIGTANTSNTIWYCTDGTSTWLSEGVAVGSTCYSIMYTPSGPSNITIAFTTGNGWFCFKMGGSWYYETPHGTQPSRCVAYYNAKWYMGFDDGRVYNSTSHSYPFTWVHEFTVTTPDVAVRSLYSYGIDMYVGGYVNSGGCSIFKYINSMLTREADHGIETFSSIEKLIVFNNNIYAGGRTTNGSLIIRSPDGIRWETVWENDTANKVITAFGIWGSYLWMAESSAGASKLYRSLSGRDWTLMWSSSFDSINDLKLWPYNSTMYAACSYAASGNAAWVYSSTNGTSWGTATTTGDTTKHFIYTLCVHGSYLFFGGGGSVSSKLIIGRTSNGTSWTYTQSGITSTYTAIARLVSFGGYIYAGGFWASDFKPVWRSTTGGSSTWSQVTGLTSSSTVSSTGWSLYAASDKIYAILNYSDVFESTNGTSWTKIHSMSNNSSVYDVTVLFDNLMTAGTRIFYRPISNLGKYIQKVKWAEFFTFYSCSNNQTDKFILKDLEIDSDKNNTIMNMTLQSHVIDLWRSFGYYMEGTNGYVDHSEDGIYADELLKKIVDGSCASRFRVKYCPHQLIKIKGEWLSKTQWLYEIAKNLSFSLNTNSTYSTSELMATADPANDVIIDKMNVVISSNGDIYIMPLGSTIAGTDPNYVGYFTKRIHDITNYVWESTKTSVNMIDYTNAIVLDGSGTGAARKNYLAKPISVEYTNDFSTLEKCQEMSNIVCEPNYSGSVRALVNTTGSVMNVWGEMLNPNYFIPIYVNVYHPSLVLSIEDTATIKASVRHDGTLDGAADTSFWKEVGFSFGGGNEAGNFQKMYRAVLKENRANATYSYFVKLYEGTTELASYTLTSGTEIDSLSSTNYLALRWYRVGGVPIIKVWMSKTAMPNPDVDTPKITYSSTNLTNDFGTIGLSSSGGFTITSATAYYGKIIPRIQAYFGEFSVTGQSMSLWNGNSITKPVMLVRDRSITSKNEARAIAMNAYQNASTTKQIKVRVDPSVYMWGTVGNRIQLGQWVVLNGKGFYDGEYRVKTIELTQTMMILGLENNRVNFTDYVDTIRQQVNKADSFG